jgi:hypothetical protein
LKETQKKEDQMKAFSDKEIPMHYYEVTGVDRSGKRFKISTSNQIHAFGINVWRGTVWIVSPDGKRKVAKRVYNF